MTDLDDHTFLVELVRQRDERPSPQYLCAMDVAAGFDPPRPTLKAIVGRLQARGLVGFTNAPRRAGDDAVSRDLVVTEAGYDRAGA